MPTGPVAARDEGTVCDRTKHRNNRQCKTALRASHPQPVKESSPGSIVNSKLREGHLLGERCGSEREEELRWKINQLEKDKLNLGSKYNKEVSGYEAQLARLRALLERGEAHRQELEYEVALAKRDAAAQNTSYEDKLTELLKHNQQHKAVSAELNQRVYDLEKALEITRQARDEDQQSHQAELLERDRLLLSSNAENDLLQSEKSRLEKLLQEQNETLQELKVKLDRVQREREKDTEELKAKKSELKQSAVREEMLRKEAESAMKRIKTLDETVESERASHLESKFNSEIIQLRLRDLEAALCVEKSSQAEAVSNLELLRQKFGDVEKAYTHERDRAKDAHHKFQQLEKEYLSTKADLIGQLDKEKVASAELMGQLEQEKAESANLFVRLQEQERVHTENLHTISLVQNKLVCVEEAHEDLIKDMQQLLQHYRYLGASQINNTGEGEKKNPSALMGILKRTLHHYHAELKDLLKVVETLTIENKEKEKIITEQRKNIQECETRCMCLGEEVERLRLSVSEVAAAAERAQVELCSVTKRWEEEREQHKHTSMQMHNLTQEHEKEQQEKLAFLHSLYQQLIAGCVLVAPPQSMLGSFSWAELSAVLQEHVDTLTSDLSSANQRIAGLESVCEGKTTSLANVCEQLKQREESWIKQRKELDTHHMQITNELQTRAQDLKRQIEKSEEKVRASERARSGLEQEVTRLQDLLSVCRRDDASLLAACALLAGCVCELFSRVCVLSHQKTLLWDRVCVGESLEKEVGALLHALSDPGQTSGKAEVKVRGGVWVFRRCVIAVLATLRLQKLRRNSHTLFRVTGGFREPPSLCVREIMLREKAQQGEEEEDERNFRVVKMLTSSELAVLIHSCMQGVQQELDKTVHSSGVLNAAQISFSKLLDRLLSETDSGCSGHYGYVGSLVQRLARGLQKLRMKHCALSNNDTSQGMVSSLQQHFLVFTQRLHSAEVERRELRLELSRLKRSTASERNKRKENTHTACVPVDQFQSVCTELSSALQREQQAQALLHQQATQLQELGLTMELHTGDQLEKDRTLAQAVQCLSETKADLKRKEQSLRLLGKRLSQSQLEKQQLQQSITSAENALRTAAKSKDSLSSYMKSVESSLKELKDRIILSRSSTSREDFNLHMPSMLLDVSGPELNMGGHEIAACQALVESFTEVYQLACSKVASLEREISSYQSHITALKAELQDACLRENQIYVPVIDSDDHAVPRFEAEVDTGTPLLLDVGVTLKEVPGNMRPSVLLPLKKSKAVKKGSKNSKSLKGAVK
ncbi:coiled-coil domain-containing protein 171 isoform X1 [Astyanax mexicanus]|uniref:coiled-coil domain-containing protein 171 isoform X1 n=1 Tax=Astyanax mexicanus TaxID=7994 RepID=UPI0020CA9E8D|nr:coiled-coil domain-containing protein 171 isoform X1 [Astyanax mexicanus]